MTCLLSIIERASFLLLESPTFLPLEFTHPSIFSQIFIRIAIVAETCSPFTVLPALMNEYRVPELNVQNGVLKSLSFLFEYIGEMGKDYIYAVTPLLEDALMDRDLVHRQTACATVKREFLSFPLPPSISFFLPFFHDFLILNLSQLLFFLLRQTCPLE